MLLFVAAADAAPPAPGWTRERTVSISFDGLPGPSSPVAPVQVPRSATFDPADVGEVAFLGPDGGMLPFEADAFRSADPVFWVALGTVQPDDLREIRLVWGPEQPLPATPSPWGAEVLGVFHFDEEPPYTAGATLDTSVPSVEGLFGKGLAVDDRVRVRSDDLTLPATVSFWTNDALLTANEAIVSFPELAVVRCRTRPDHLGLFTGDWLCDNAASVLPGQWHQIVVSGSGSGIGIVTVRIWLDGQLVIDAAGLSLASDASPILFGDVSGGFFGQQVPYDGGLDEVRVWTGTPSLAQVAVDYALVAEPGRIVLGPEGAAPTGGSGGVPDNPPGPGLPGETGLGAASYRLTNGPCGCATPAAPQGWLLALVGAAVARRRRVR
ncbi:MAG: LamG-like jellyroll fold domain-containing protein [Myxococcota bacterium]